MTKGSCNHHVGFWYGFLYLNTILGLLRGGANPEYPPPLLTPGSTPRVCQLTPNIGRKPNVNIIASFCLMYTKTVIE